MAPGVDGLNPLAGDGDWDRKGDSHLFAASGGTATLGNGTLDPAAIGAVVIAPGVTVSGPGTIDGDLINAGILRLNLGTLNILANFTQHGTGTLWMQADAPSHGRVLVAGNVTLAGRFKAEFINGYDPDPFATFAFLVFGGARMGTFDMLEVAGWDPAFWQLDYSVGDRVTLRRA